LGKKTTKSYFLCKFAADFNNKAKKEQMKKLLIAAVALVSAWGAVNAQDFKPGKGNVTADLSLFSKGIFATESPVMLNSGMLKGRYFISDGMALRGALSLMNDSQKDTSDENVTKKQSKSQFGMRFGLEKHFSGTDRLSPYIGADIGLAYQTQSSSSEPKQGDKTKVEGPGTFGLGMGLFFGADYYFVKNVYLGVEAGLDLGTTSVGSVTHTSGGTSTTGQKAGSSSAISVGANAGFKLGFVF